MTIEIGESCIPNIDTAGRQKRLRSGAQAFVFSLAVLAGMLLLEISPWWRLALFPLFASAATERVVNFLNAMTMEIQMLARCCGKSDVHNLEPEDLRSLTLEAEAITGIPLVGRIHR